MEFPLQAPMEPHCRFLTQVNEALPPHLKAVAQAFIEPGRALGHHELERFERLIGPNHMGDCPPYGTLGEALAELPGGRMRTRARIKIAEAADRARADEWAQAVHSLIEAKDAAVRALV